MPSKCRPVRPAPPAPPSLRHFDCFTCAEDLLSCRYINYCVTKLHCINCLYEARREPQRGPGKHYRGALSPPFCMSRDRDAEGVEREERGERCSLTIRLGVRGSVVGSPSGVRGAAPAENGFYAYFRSERSHLGHHFQYF